MMSSAAGKYSVESWPVTPVEQQGKKATEGESAVDDEEGPNTGVACEMHLAGCTYALACVLRADPRNCARTHL